jgi:predicted nucleotidyltransferase
MTSDDSDLRDALAGWAEEEPACRLLVLFGSEATGGTWAESDVDVAVACDPVPSPRERLRMIGELEDRCGGRRADVVFLGPETDPVLRHEVFRDGEPLYEAGPGLFVEQRVRAVMLHQDALPFRRALVERMGAVG